MCVGFSAWLTVVLASLPHAMLTTTLDPQGKNVCIAEESFKVTVEVTEWYEQRYRDSEWCMRIPPRCTVYKWRWATRDVPKEVTKTRQVAQCCQGYVPNGADCKPHCHEPCRHGACTLPDTCTCFSGFWGPFCQEICSRGTWGSNCTKKCDCQNDAFCNPISGVCLCSPGWEGSRCTEACKEGFFGIECRRPCNCQELLCHHITGECSIPVSTTELSIATFTIAEFISTTLSDSSSTTENSTPAPPQTTLSTTQTTPYLEIVNNLISTDDNFSTTTEQTKHLTSTSSPNTATLSSLMGEGEGASRTSPAELKHTTDFIVPTTESLTQDSSTASSTSISFSSAFPSSGSTFNGDFTLNFSSSEITSQMTPNVTATDTTTEIFQMYSDTSTSQSLNNLTTAMPGLEESRRGAQELAGLAVTIALSVFGSLILLFAAAGVALARHRKTPNPTLSEPATDTGLYRFYAEEPLPVKTVFLNPTYGCGDFDDSLEQPHLNTFKTADDSFEAELRGILESQYDHPPLPISRTSTPFDHLYDEISNSTDARTYFSRYS